MNKTLLIATLLGCLFSVLCIILLALRFQTRGHRPRLWPQAPDDSKAIQMPPEYLKPEPRTVRDLLPGETGYINWTGVSVSPQGRVYVPTDEKLANGPSRLTAKVSRERNGIVLTMPAGFESTFRYTPRPLYRSAITYLPVIELLIEPSADRPG